jgi:hypothetical protein
MSRNRNDDPMEAFPSEGVRVVPVAGASTSRRTVPDHPRRFTHLTDAALIEATHKQDADGDAATRELQRRVLVAHLTLVNELRPALATRTLFNYALLALGIIQFAILVWILVARS